MNAELNGRHLQRRRRAATSTPTRCSGARAAGAGARTGRGAGGAHPALLHQPRAGDRQGLRLVGEPHPRRRPLGLDRGRATAARSHRRRRLLVGADGRRRPRGSGSPTCTCCRATTSTSWATARRRTCWPGRARRGRRPRRPCSALVVLLDGRLAGFWKRTSSKNDELVVEAALFDALRRRGRLKALRTGRPSATPAFLEPPLRERHNEHRHNLTVERAPEREADRACALG